MRNCMCPYCVKRIGILYLIDMFFIDINDIAPCPFCRKRLSLGGLKYKYKGLFDYAAFVFLTYLLLNSFFIFLSGLLIWFVLSISYLLLKCVVKAEDEDIPFKPCGAKVLWRPWLFQRPDGGIVRWNGYSCVESDYYENKKCPNCSYIEKEFVEISRSKSRESFSCPECLCVLEVPSSDGKILAWYVVGVVGLVGVYFVNSNLLVYFLPLFLLFVIYVYFWYLSKSKVVLKK